MVKKIRVIDEPIEETTEDVSMETFYELAKTMDWKLWEILQIMQRFEKKIQVLDNQDADSEVVKKSSK
jgi:hypothetical protein